MNKKPLVLLDVDGVINALCSEDDTPPDFDDWDYVECGFSPIRYSKKLLKQLIGLDLDIHWLTTWGNAANEHLAPLFGWDPLPVIERAGHDRLAGPNGWWKSSAAHQFVNAQNRPFIWIDDDLDYSINEGDVPWLEDCTIPHLIVSPDARTGISVADFDKMRQFIQQHQTISTTT